MFEGIAPLAIDLVELLKIKFLVEYILSLEYVWRLSAGELDTYNHALKGEGECLTIIVYYSW